MKILALAAYIAIFTSLFSNACGSANGPDPKYPTGSGDTVFSAERTLSDFWESVQKGDKHRLDGLTMQPPADWWSGCSSSEPLSGNRTGTGNTKYTVRANDNVVLSDDSISANSEMDELFASDNVSETVQSFAQYVHASYVAWDRVKILETRSINDEVLLRISVLPRNGDESSATTYAVAFIRVDNRNKMIGVVQIGVLDFVDDQLHFASPRSKCTAKA